MAQPKLLFFDLECSNLKAPFGFIICAGYKFMDEQAAHVISITDFPQFQQNPTDDSQVVRAMSKVMEQADVVLTWYGERFDVPFLNSRLLKHNLPPLAPANHIDLWRTSKYKLAMHSNRLDAVATFLGTKNQKTVLNGEIWTRATSGHRPSIAYIVKHCKADVLVLEEVYKQLRPLVAKHPNLAIFTDRGSCPHCGMNKLVKNGTRLTASYRYVRYQCHGCGAWVKGERIK